MTCLSSASKFFLVLYSTVTMDKVASAVCRAVYVATDKHSQRVSLDQKLKDLSQILSGSSTLLLRLSHCRSNKQLPQRASVAKHPLCSSELSFSAFTSSQSSFTTEKVVKGAHPGEDNQPKI